VCWDGDYVVYNRLSGSTHVLDIVAGEVLMSIMENRPSTGAVYQRIAAFLEVPNDTLLASQVDAILETLDALGLIEPLHEC